MHEEEEALIINMSHSKNITINVSTDNNVRQGLFLTIFPENHKFTSTIFSVIYTKM